MVSATVVAAGSTLTVLATTRAASLPDWATEAGIALVITGVIGSVLPAVLPARLVRIRSAGGPPEDQPGPSSSLAPGVRAHTGSEGTV